jgi:putative redox protein
MAIDARLELDGDMRFTVTTRTGHEMVLDTADGGAGPTPKELMPVSLGGCMGMDVISILRKMKQNVQTMKVLVEGEIAEEHPRRFIDWMLVFSFTGEGIEPEKVSRAIALSRDRYCGVCSSFDPEVPCRLFYSIDGSEPEAVPKPEAVAEA